MTKGKLLVLAAVIALGSPAVAHGADYTDPSGDNGADADVGVVSVSSGADGYLHVKLNVANMPALLSPGSIALGLDTDRNEATGGGSGADYLIVVVLDDASGIFTKWDGSTYAVEDVPQGELRYLVGGGGLEFLIRPSLIGAPTSFGFWAGVATGAIEEDRFDRAPDTGAWIYESRPVQQPAPAPAVSVERVDATFVPAPPRSGTTFRPALVRIKLSTGRWLVTNSYRCVATLGGNAIRGTGRGGCTLKLPKNAKGKRLRVTFFVTYKGNTDEFEPYSFRVR